MQRQLVSHEKNLNAVLKAAMRKQDEILKQQQAATRKTLLAQQAADAKAAKEALKQAAQEAKTQEVTQSPPEMQPIHGSMDAPETISAPKTEEPKLNELELKLEPTKAEDKKQEEVPGKEEVKSDTVAV